MAYANADDVATEAGRPAPSAEEEAQWEIWIERVERKILARFRARNLDLAARIAAGTLTVADVRDIEVAAVLRKLDPTWGQTSRSSTRQVDDGSVTDTIRHEGGVPIGNPLDLLPDEWAVLLPPTGGSAFSVTPHSEPVRAPWDLW